MTELSLYERLGGAFAIAAVVDHFSDALVNNPIVGQNSENPDLREWHTNNLDRLPGLKFMRTLWVATLPVDLSNMQARNRAVLRSAWKKPIAN
jgi:hemoglobin